MATTSIPGYTGRCYFSINAGASYEEFGELQDVELHFTQDLADASSHSSGGHKEFTATMDTWDATASGLYIFNDAGQGDLVSMMLSKTKFLVRFDPGGTTVGKDRFSGTVWVKDFKLTEKTSDLAGVSLILQGTGALAKATQ